MRAALCLSTLIFFVFADFSWSQPVERRIEITENGDYFGNDLRAERGITLDACQALCLEDTQCRAFTYNVSAQWCFLKSDFSEIKPFDGAVAGRVVEIAAEPDIGAPTPLAFLLPGTSDEAVRFRVTAIAAAQRSDFDADSAIQAAIDAVRAGDSQAAEQLFSVAAGKGEDSARNWFAVALAALQNNNGDWRIRRLAVNAAINAYGLTRTASTRAGALGALARALELQGEYRPALTAYQRSLELVDSPELKEAYRDLRRREGFRVTGNTIDADNNSPRVCIQFSETLPRSGVDFAQFVTVDGKTGAIEAEERQLCATGLRHANSYRISVRAGLPSTVGEVLESPTIIEAYIRDRSPSVRFSGEKFVLPRQARRGIPVYGVNADSAQMRLFRVGERSLARLIANNQFLTQLGGYELDQLRDELGQPIWEGSLDLNQEQNREVATSFPLDEVLSSKEPGIYALTAIAAGSSDEYWAAKATQWFLVSDIGLTTHTGSDGLNVFVRSLDTAKSINGVELTLIARNNEILGRATTDESGRALFDAGLLRGTGGLDPTLLTALNPGRGAADDFVFLDLSRAGFDLSDRGVSGRAAPGPIDIFSYLDRGIYRPGETVHGVALSRDDAGQALSDLPLTVQFVRPDGVVAHAIASTDPVGGGHLARFAIPESAMRGVWRVEFHTDPNQAPLAEETFLVEDFLPDRIEFDLDASRNWMSAESPLPVAIEGRFLYGAPASDLAVEAELRLQAVRSLSGFDGYEFGLLDEEGIVPSLRPLAGLPRTDSAGRANIEVQLGALPAANRPLTAQINVRLRETGGRAVERQLDVAVRDGRSLIGVRPQFDGPLGENQTARFDIIALDESRNLTGLDGLNWALYRIEQNYQWYRDGYSWRYEAVQIPRLEAEGQIDVAAGTPAIIATATQWGRYRLEIESPDPDGPATSVAFNAGYYTAGSPAETPDIANIALDKASYLAGETARLRIEARHAGVAMVTIGSDRVNSVIEAEISAGTNTLDIEVQDSWGAGAYVTATLFRAGEEEDRRSPSRAIGTTWLQIDPAAREIDLAFELPERVEPSKPLIVPVRARGIAANTKAYLTVAVVDVGILNLTRHEVPDPANWYFGQRRLGLEIRDLYGRLIDSSPGAFGKVRSGGDGPGMTAEGSPPTEALLALHSGIIQFDENGDAEIEFQLPAFNGTARIMAVAWTARSVGAASSDLIIRDPIVLNASMPKVLAPADNAEGLVEIANTDGSTGEYQLAIEGNDTVSISALPEKVTLEAGSRVALPVSIVADRIGDARIRIDILREGEIIASRNQTFRVRPATQPVATRSEFELASGRAIQLDRRLLAGSEIGGAQIGLTVSNAAGFDVNALLMKLDRYPYGCAEQTTSRALPLLYLSDFNVPDAISDPSDLQERIEKAITRVLSFQSANGSFGLWGPGDGEFWLDAYVTDFLTRAVEKGFTVPDAAMRQALANLQNKIGYLDQLATDGDAIAYALYVLARNRRASAGDLRYYADSRLLEFATPLSRAQLAAALSLYNENERASRVFRSAVALAEEGSVDRLARADYGSELRDGAAMLTLVSESRTDPTLIPELVEFVEERMLQKAHTSTQENAWMVLAARAVQEGDRALQLELNGKPITGALSVRSDGEALLETPIEVRNLGTDGVTALVTTLASPDEPLAAGGEGFAISRRYYTLDGNEASLVRVAQNQRFVVVLDVTELNETHSRVLVSDLLPGGFEIDNPRLVNSASLENFDWIGETEAAHLEFRDDRFVAAFNRRPDSPRAFRLAYVVRAVTPGRFVHPAAGVEDMYRPDLAARTGAGFVEIVPSAR